MSCFTTVVDPEMFAKKVAALAAEKASILFLTLYKAPFDEILAGTKRQEYREYKQHWKQQLLVGGEDGHFRHFDYIQFSNGFRRDSPRMLVKCLGVRSEGTVRFVIELGDVVCGCNLAGHAVPQCPRTPAPYCSAGRQPPNIKLAHKQAQQAVLQAREAELAARVARINQAMGIPPVTDESLRGMGAKRQLFGFPGKRTGPRDVCTMCEGIGCDCNAKTIRMPKIRRETEKQRIQRELDEFDDSETFMSDTEYEEQLARLQCVARPAKRVRNADGWYVPVGAGCANCA